MTNVRTKSSFPERVVLGMSGGIDSTISVLRLQNKGHIVTGVTFIFAPNFNKKKEIPNYATEASALAKKLGIEHYIIDLRESFTSTIVAPFYNDYLKGQTPFPCALCNKQMKWHHLYEQMLKLGCSKMATGHYARKVMQDGFSCISAHADQIKDQTYFLWGIPQKFLEHILFPLQDITKEEVKQVARDYNFTHFDDKKESFGVCFAPDGDYLSYMKASLPGVAKKIQPGNFVTQSGKVVGRHKGLIHYTIGQRKDLELYTDEELYVQKIVPEKNQVIVGPEASLLCDSILLRDYEIHNPEALKAESLEIKTTYRGKTTSGKAMVVGPHLQVTFDQPAKAMAPGQTAVLYKEGVLVAGGFIV